MDLQPAIQQLDCRLPIRVEGYQHAARRVAWIDPVQQLLLWQWGWTISDLPGELRFWLSTIASELHWADECAPEIKAASLGRTQSLAGIKNEGMVQIGGSLAKVCGFVHAFASRIRRSRLHAGDQEVPGRHTWNSAGSGRSGVNPGYYPCLPRFFGAPVLGRIGASNLVGH